MLLSGQTSCGLPIYEVASKALLLWRPEDQDLWVARLGIALTTAAALTLAGQWRELGA